MVVIRLIRFTLTWSEKKNTQPPPTTTTNSEIALNTGIEKMYASTQAHLSRLPLLRRFLSPIYFWLKNTRKFVSIPLHCNTKSVKYVVVSTSEKSEWKNSAHTVSQLNHLILVSISLLCVCVCVWAIECTLLLHYFRNERRKESRQEQRGNAPEQRTNKHPNRITERERKNTKAKV